jgi:hypothetical protein
MYPAKLNEDGALEEIYKPAIYIDTNFLRYYFIYEGTEELVDDRGNPVNYNNSKNYISFEAKTNDIIRNVVGYKDYLEDFAYIRRIAIYHLSNASLIISPISFLELYKIHAEISFKEFCAEALGAKHIQRMGVKEVGNCLSKIYKKYLENKENDVLSNIVQSTVFNMSFARAHGLEGIFYVSDLNLILYEGDIGNFLWILAYLQLDTTDILHLHAAKLLNCDYFATFDSGFTKNSQIIEKFTGIKIISTSKDVIQVLEENRKVSNT